LYVFSRGTITTTNLVANSNGGVGAWLDNSTIQGKSITLKGFKQFNGNGGDGLMIISSGAITLNNVVANNNLGNGVYLDNKTSTASLGITLSGTNFTMNNGLNGTMLLSHGMIAASNLNASDNDGSGAILDNCIFDGVSACTIATGKAVKVSGVNTFNKNASHGLTINSFGSISISNVIASNNAGNGANLNNQWSNQSLLNSTGTLTVTGYGMFQNNGGSGLVGTTYGNAMLANINASDNDGTGLYLEAVKALGGSAITLSGVNYFMVNNDSGLELTASGTITLNNVTASWNSDSGAVIFNSLVPDKSYNVTLKGTNAFNHNGDDGLYVDTNGAIKVNNLTANDNGEGSSTGSGAILNNCSCSPKAVTLTGYVNTSDNIENGLIVNSAGAVTLTNVTAEWNGLVGAVIQNDDDPAKAQPVTIKGTNLFNHNGEEGLLVYSYGAILINNLMALSNGASGVFGTGVTLDNCDWDSSACMAQSPKAVTITGYAHASGNEDGGLYIYSNGAVTLNNVTAESNGEDGVFIENMTNAPKGQAVTLKGSNSFNQNGEDGLDIRSMGAITANNISAFGNQNGAGARLDNNASLQPAKVTLSGVNTFVGNFLDGLSVNSDGAVVLSRVTADGNGWDIAPGDGIYVDTTGSITLTCAATTNQINGAGYVLISTGNAAITIKGLYSAGNNNPDAPITTGLVKITNPCMLP
jgi:putative surface-exposed virulence protein